jgi:type II secretory pathway pseudopilin PulG
LTSRGPGISRAGFTLVEALLVLVTLSIVVRIAVPNLQWLLRRARATEILGEVSRVETAAAQYMAERFRWPPDAPAGEIPPGLGSFLGEGYTFEHEGYTLDWESWELPDGLPSDPDVRALVAVTVVPATPSLEDALRGLVSGSPGWFVVGDSYTFVVEPAR